MKLLLRVLTICLCFSLSTYGDGNTFDRVRSQRLEKRL
jgi:hypothetical protein